VYAILPKDSIGLSDAYEASKLFLRITRNYQSLAKFVQNNGLCKGHSTLNILGVIHGSCVHIISCLALGDSYLRVFMLYTCWLSAYMTSSAVVKKKIGYTIF
jgi:hypothetical protein